MELSLASKEENNRRREEEFLKLSPVERIMDFIDRLSKPTVLPTKDDIGHKNDIKGNFILYSESYRKYELERINKTRKK
ncbi:hypothetical protein [Lentimicrobium sp. S6]|uniref:hypothetical protein n=1 Tax=Lentimicrobium sp. S6 TaxID=2735872 RepID=UPI0015516E44|nr:hypothetical protein [Lentimicrobium sp. S6]MBF8984757.1 hypothetical protein [Lutibacter sp. B2]NPD47402.1 hypothetical protein [Lentimicrobium sp. S6]